MNRYSADVLMNEKDVEQAKQLIQQGINLLPNVLSKPKRHVRIKVFTSCSVLLKVLFWSEEVFAVGKMLGEIRLLILKSFQENKITMSGQHPVITSNKR
ncbi:MAG: hypothetical protein IPO86_00740 [Saprospiraceae bacterium]|nr:hypothetical protein [Saprospiraceae bacterium]MBK9726621.1 hypothetical protein [Saprospiraceae bacterium]